MDILVIDAQGGGLGKQIIVEIKKKFDDIDITCVGTNSIATSAMLKAGADHAATGENAICVNSKNCDVIIGPIGIILTDSLYGEITQKMALAVQMSKAKRILIPFKHEENVIVGIGDYSLKKLVEAAIKELENYIKAKN